MDLRNDDLHAAVLLALKLILVPTFLLLVSLAGRRWGASVAGWLAGLPVVAGPIVLLVALEQGTEFASAASSASLAAVFAAVTFGASYSHAAMRMNWPGALVVAICAWSIAAALLALLPNAPLVSATVAAIALVGARWVFPAVAPPAASRAFVKGELALRMAAGAALTLIVTALANTVGSRWSGLLAVFPVLGSVLAVFSHRGQGAAFAATLLRALANGLWSLAAFFLVTSLALRTLGTTNAFVLAVAAATAVQVMTRWLRV
jgi:uncharacterized membrane protein (GlpM family)